MEAQKRVLQGRRSVTLAYSGAPRSMKMGNIVSPWRYDAGAYHALKSVNVRRPAISRYASEGLYRHGLVVRLPFDSGHADPALINWRKERP